VGRPPGDAESDTPALLTAIEAVAKQKMTSFHGCYHGSSFVLNDDLGVTTDCEGNEVTGYVEPAPSRQCDVPPNPCAYAATSRARRRSATARSTSRKTRT